MKIVRPKKSGVVCMTSDISIPLDGSFSDAQIEKLKDDLTFDNPAYAAAKRFTRYNSICIDPMLFYYAVHCKTLHVPRGADLSSLNYPSIQDKRTDKCLSTVPKFVLDLRPDQKKAAEAYLTCNQGTNVCGGVQLPTGKGKTILALYLSAKLKQRTLILVHKDDLVEGWTKDIALSFNHKVTPGIIKAQKRVVGDFITIATVQTLSRMDECTLEKYLRSFGFVVLDEMHHCPSTTFSIVDQFTARYRLGLSATPERKDGLAHVMNLYFGGFCYVYESTSAEKDILPVEVIKRVMPFTLEPLCERTQHGFKILNVAANPDSYTPQKGECWIRAIDYVHRPHFNYTDISLAATTCAKKYIAKDVLKEYKSGHSCIVFFSQKISVDTFRAFLLENGVSPKSVVTFYGDNSSKVNEASLIRADNERSLITLTTFSKATEGTNVKQWECAFLASSINDGKNAEQAVGRIRRVLQGHKINPVRLYDYRFDHVYAMFSHGATRDMRYKKLGFKIREAAGTTAKTKRTKNPLFTRGYTV